MLRPFCLAALLVFGGGIVTANSDDPWISPAFGYRVEITNLSPAFGIPLQDFPLLVVISNAPWIKAAANLSTTGDNLTFADPNGQQLFHQVEGFSKTAGNLTAWVCIPSFTNFTRIYLYYGFDTTKSPGGVPFTGSNTTTAISGVYPNLFDNDIVWNVWDPNFLVVYHFNETSGYFAKDSTRNQIHSYTNYTNVYMGSNGIGLSKGYWSLPLKGGSGWNGGGVRSKAFLTTGTALYETVRSNTLTHSVWFKHQASISNNPFYTNSHSDLVVSGTSTGFTETLFALKGSSSMGSDDGKGVITWDRNSLGRASFASHATSLPTAMSLFGATNTNAQHGIYSNWFYYSIAATNTGSTKVLETVANDLVNRYTGSGTFDTTTSIGELAVIGSYDSSSGSTPGLTYRISPYGMADEYRMSRGSRTTNWSITEFSNVILSTNMMLNNVVGIVEPLLSARITNLTFFPSPVAGGTLILGLDNASLIVPNRPPSFVSNVNWYITNYDTGFSSVTDLTYTGDDFFYSNTLLGIAAGNYMARVTLTADDFVGSPIVYNFPVGTEALYDLRNFTVFQTNAGFVVDFFRGLDGGAARPTSNLIYRDGTLVNPLLSNYTGGRFLDTNDLFYDEAHAYRVVVQYSNSLFLTNSMTVSAAKAPSVGTIGVAGGVLENFEMRATVPAGAVSANRNFSLLFPSDTLGIDGYRQMTLDDGNGVFELFNQPITLRLKVRVAGGVITVPGTTKRLVLNDANKLRLGYWDGFQWNPLPTVLTSYSNRVELTSQVTREGRFALLFNDGSGSAVESFRIRNRVVQPGASDPVYGSVYFGWDKGLNDKASLTVMNHSGRVVYQRKDMVDPFWLWDGKGSDGSVVDAGLYIYQVALSSGKTYRGTLAVMSK